LKISRVIPDAIYFNVADRGMAGIDGPPGLYDFQSGEWNNGGLSIQ
jgi:hypothetical protein